MSRRDHTDPKLLSGGVQKNKTNNQEAKNRHNGNFPSRRRRTEPQVASLSHWF